VFHSVGLCELICPKQAAHVFAPVDPSFVVLLLARRQPRSDRRCCGGSLLPTTARRRWWRVEHQLVNRVCEVHVVRRRCCRSFALLPSLFRPFAPPLYQVCRVPLIMPLAGNMRHTHKRSVRGISVRIRTADDRSSCSRRWHSYW